MTYARSQAGTTNQRNIALLTPILPPPVGTPVKWYPGQGVESDTVLSKNGTLASVQSEINMISSLDNVLHYMILVTWSMLQQVANVYTFTALDAIINYLTNRGSSAMNTPKNYWIQIICGSFTKTNPAAGDFNIVPQYIQQSSAFGQAGFRVGGVTTQPAGVFGWWGGDGNGNTYAAALWRPAVMAEYIKLCNAVGARYDSDLRYGGIYQGEDSFYQGTGSTNGADYNDTTQRNNWNNWLTSVCTSHPTTSVAFSETFLQVQPNSIALTNNITDGTFPNHPPLMAQTDSLGAVQRGAIHTWGTQTYAGQLGTLGNRISTGRFVAEVQAPDQGFFINLGSPREDIKAGLDVLGCTHSFWAILPSPTAITTKPAKYPCTFTANVVGLSGTLSSNWPLPSGTYDVVTNAGGRGTFTKGSKNVTFSTSQSSTTNVISINFPLVPFNWFNGGTATAAQNGTSLSYTDPGLGVWLNDPANALANSAYPPGYPQP